MFWRGETKKATGGVGFPSDAASGGRHSALLSYTHFFADQHTRRWFSLRERVFTGEFVAFFPQRSDRCLKVF